MTISYATCPACSAPAPAADYIDAHNRTIYGVKQCPECLALYGQCYLGESHGLVLPYWHEGPSDPADERCYDFLTLSSKGVDRRHGWFNVRTRRITQTG